MSSQVLFDRAWAVTIGIPGQPGAKYTGIRVAFDIDKNTVGTSNKAKIRIWNLNALSRKHYQRAGFEDLKNVFQIRLEAGYAGNLRTIYLGDIRKPENKRDGSSIVTSFECGTSEKSLLNAMVSRNYPPGTRYLDVIKDLLNALEVNVGPILGVKDFVYNSALVLNGTVRDALDRVLAAQRLLWSIQDGSVEVYPLGAHNGSTAVIVSNQNVPSKGVVKTGLIGVPSQNELFTQFQSLLNPALAPGVPVQIWSETIRGDFFAIRRAHYEGDSHGAKWQVNCECLPAPGVQILNSETAFVTRGLA